MRLNTIATTFKFYKFMYFRCIGIFNKTFFQYFMCQYFHFLVYSFRFRSKLWLFNYVAQKKNACYNNGYGMIYLFWAAILTTLTWHSLAVVCMHVCVCVYSIYLQHVISIGFDVLGDNICYKIWHFFFFIFTISFAWLSAHEKGFLKARIIYDILQYVLYCRIRWKKKRKNGFHSSAVFTCQKLIKLSIQLRLEIWTFFPYFSFIYCSFEKWNTAVDKAR